MGRASIKPNKNIYQTSREDLKWSRAKASEMLECISESQIEKYEDEKTVPRPEDVVRMSEVYKKPDLCNYYCTHECAIGKIYVPEVKKQALPQIILEMLASLNAVNQDRDRLIEIAADGEIHDDELEDFVMIQDKLQQISMTVDSLKLWVNNTIASGKIDKSKLEEIQKSVR